MRIAINTRLLLKDKLEGIGWFTYETMKRITLNHPEHEFFFLFDRAFDTGFIFSSNIKPVVLYPQARHPLLWYTWFEYSVRKFIENNNIDIFISTDGFISLKTNIPQIAVIHDINFFHYPKALPFFVRKYYNHYFPKFAHKSARIVTVSQFSKFDIAKSYKIDHNKIDVAWNGANSLYKPLTLKEAKEIRNGLTNGSPYFVFVGAFNPRKNITRLLQAFDLFKTNNQSDVKLVIVGDKMYGTTTMMKVYNSLKYKDDVIFTGRLQVEKLSLIIGAAHALTFVSYYEGFGIPLLEAMNCDIPILASNCTSIPEVAGNAAIYVDPFDIDSISKGMVLISFDENLRAELIQGARMQRDKFNWDYTANALYDSAMKAYNTDKNA